MVRSPSAAPDADRRRREADATRRVQALAVRGRRPTTPAGRAGVMAVATMVVALGLPWADTYDGVTASAIGAGDPFTLSVVAIVGMAILVVGAVAVADGARRVPVVLYSLGGALVGLVVIGQTVAATDDVVERRLAGPGTAVAGAVVLVAAGLGGARAQRRRPVLRATAVRPWRSDGGRIPDLHADVDMLERWFARRRPADRLTTGVAGAGVVLAGALALWAVALGGAWVAVSGDGSASTIGFDVPEATWPTVALVIAAVAAGIALTSARWAWPAAVVVAGSSLAGLVATIRAAAAIDVTTAAGSIGTGGGAGLAIAASSLAAVAGVALCASWWRARPARRPAAIIAIVALSTIAGAVGVAPPRPSGPIRRDGVTVWAFDGRSARPSASIGDAGLDVMVVDDNVVYATADGAGDIELLPLVGRRFGGTVTRAAGGGVALGTFGHWLIYRADLQDVWRAALPGIDDPALDRGEQLLATDVYDPVLGPDGALWFQTADGELARIADVSDTDRLDATTIALEIPPPDRLLAAVDGAVVARYDIGRRLVVIGTDGSARTVLGGVGDPTCGPSADATRTATSYAEPILTDAAGNLWVPQDDGGVAVVRAADAAVVDVMPALVDRGLVPPSTAALRPAGVANERGAIALLAADGATERLVLFDDAPAFVAGLAADEPEPSCHSLRVDVAVAPMARVAPPPAPSGASVTALVPEGWVVQDGSSARIVGPSGEVTIDDPDIASGVWSAVRALDGSRWWITSSGAIARLTGGTVTTIAAPSATEPFVAVQPALDDTGTIGLACGQAACQLWTIEGPDALVPGPRLVATEDRQPVGLDAVVGRRALVVDLGLAHRWVSLDDGAAERVGVAGDLVLTVNPDASVVIEHADGQVVTEGSTGPALRLAAPTAERRPTLAQLAGPDPTADELDIFARDVVVDPATGSSYVLTDDEILLAIAADGRVSYLAGGGPFVAGANGSLDRVGDLTLTADAVIVSGFGGLVRVPRPDGGT